MRSLRKEQVLKRNILAGLILLFLCSCQEQRNLNKHLETGLLNLKNVRKIDGFIVDGFGIEELGIIKKNDSVKYLIFKLDDKSNTATIEKYRVGVLFYLNDDNSKKEGLLGNVKKKSFDFSPVVKTIKENRYIINKITTKIEKVDELDLYIYQYSNGKITKLEKNRISVKKISLI